MRSIIDKGLYKTADLQRMQERFCSVAEVLAFGVDTKGVRLTKLPDGEEEKDGLLGCLYPDQIEQLIERASRDGLSDQTVEDTGRRGVKAAVIPVRAEESAVFFWIVLAALEDADGQKEEDGSFSYINITEKKFYRALDLLREMSAQYISGRYITLRAEAEERKNELTRREMSETIDRIETFTRIVHFLDSDGAVDEILRNILMLTGKWLGVESCLVFRTRKDQESAEVLAQWRAGEDAPLPGQGKRIEWPRAVRADTPVVLSSDSVLPPEQEEFLKRAGIGAVMVFPLYTEGDSKIYVCFCEETGKRSWELYEIKFISDTAKVIQNIITRRIQKNSLAGSYEVLEEILDNVGSAIYVRDSDSGSMLFANHILKSAFAGELREGLMDRVLMQAGWDGVTGNHEVCNKAMDSWYDLYRTTIRWIDGRNVELYALYDITDKKLYQKKIEQQAYTDFLTGLYNRMRCERDISRQIENAEKRGEEGALLYMDLDDFKHINDGLGHQYGDVLLKAISHSLKRIEGIGNTCYRMGGDEFVIIIPPESYGRSKEILNEIKAIFEKPWFLKDADYYCTMSMGVVNFPSEGESVQELIKKADIAMYEAKRGGKNRVSRYSESSMVGSSKRLDMEKNMRGATADGYREFEVFYQPIIDNRRKGCPCTGAEALIRWNSTELGFISPAEFIPLAEYLGLINPIGNHVLRQACLACKGWNDTGYSNYKVNVNLSVVQLLQPDIVEIVGRTLRETGLSPANLTLEVTESLAINDMDRMKEILGSIKKLGVRIALDDFGTGYSSLNHIREIPLDVIKVDQSFVKDLAVNSYSQSFIKMVSELADAIGVNVCVEGIETKAQYEVLEGMKVSLIQGFYFGMPMRRTEFEEKYVQPKNPKNGGRK